MGCPFCDADVSNHDLDIDSLDDESSDFFQCAMCDKFFKVTLLIFKQYDYIVGTPTAKEIKDNSLITNKDPDILVDVYGQSFMWEDLFLNES